MLRFLSSLFYLVNFAQYKSTLALSVTILFLRQNASCWFPVGNYHAKSGRRDVIAQIMIEGKNLESQFFSPAENDNDNSNNNDSFWDVGRVFFILSLDALCWQSSSV